MDLSLDLIQIRSRNKEIVHLEGDLETRNSQLYEIDSMFFMVDIPKF